MPEIRIMIPENMDRALSSLIRAGLAGNKAELVRGAITQYLSNVPTILSKDYDLESVFSPDGRILQVEYAMIASDKGFPSIGMQCHEGIVLMKQIPYSKNTQFSFMRSNSSQNPIKVISNKIHISMSGISTDGNLLIREARRIYSDKIQNESCDLYKFAEDLSFFLHSYTIKKELRVLGAKFIFGGLDKDKIARLFLLGPSGSIHESSLVAIGNENKKIIENLKQAYKPEMSLEKLCKLGLKAMNFTKEDLEYIKIEFLKNEIGEFTELSDEEKIAILK